MSKIRPTQELKSGDILTKMEVCNLFCEKLRISRDTYYRQVYPLLKFRNLGELMGTIGDNRVTTERMPYDIAIGIIHKIMDTPHENDPDDYKLNRYFLKFPKYGI